MAGYEITMFVSMLLTGIVFFILLSLEWRWDLGYPDDSDLNILVSLLVVLCFVGTSIHIHSKMEKELIKFAFADEILSCDSYDIPIAPNRHITFKTLDKNKNKITIKNILYEIDYDLLVVSVAEESATSKTLKIGNVSATLKEVR